MNLILFKHGKIMFTPVICRNWAVPEILTMEDWVCKDGLILPTAVGALVMRQFINNGKQGAVEENYIDAHIGMMVTPKGDIFDYEFNREKFSPTGVKIFAQLRSGMHGHPWARSPLAKIDRMGAAALALCDDLEEAFNLVDQAEPMLRTGYKVWEMTELVDWINARMQEKGYL